MKLNAGKRVLMFLHWLASLLICAALVLLVVKRPLAMDLWRRAKAVLSLTQLKIIAVAALALYAILAILQLILIFKRRKRSDRGFIVMDSSDAGRVRIAVSAIEQMVRQSVTNIDGISEMRIKIENADDAIDIGVNASIVNGGHVPTITLNMQRAIRQFVEMNCGVAVHAVPISIKSVTAPGEDKRFGRRKDKDAVIAAAPVVENPPAAEPEPAVEPAPAPTAPWDSAADSAPAPEAAPIAPWDSAAGSAESEPEAQGDAPAEEEIKIEGDIDLSSEED